MTLLTPEDDLDILGYAMPTWSSRYRDMFRCEMCLDQDRNEIRFPARFLRAPFSLAEPSVAELCIKQCEGFLTQPIIQEGLFDDTHQFSNTDQ